MLKKGLILLKENDGITVAELDKKIIFAARRHTIKFSGNENNLQENSDQPYYSENKDISLIFNGEFYNFENTKKLKKKGTLFKTQGDTEVLLKLYESYGIEFLRDKGIDYYIP